GLTYTIGTPSGVSPSFAIPYSIDAGKLAVSTTGAASGNATVLTTLTLSAAPGTVSFGTFAPVSGTNNVTVSSGPIPTLLTPKAIVISGPTATNKVTIAVFLPFTTTGASTFTFNSLKIPAVVSNSVTIGTTPGPATGYGAAQTNTLGTASGNSRPFTI